MGHSGAPGWRRWAARLGLCALLGVATTYVVAWGCAAFVEIDPLKARDAYTVYDHRVWQARIMGGGGSISVDWMSETGYKGGTNWKGEPAADEVLWVHAIELGRLRSVGEPLPAPAWGRPRIEDGEPGKHWVRGATSVAHGWPRLAVWCSVIEDIERIGAWERSLVAVGPPSNPPPPGGDGWDAFPTQGMVSPLPRPVIVSGGFVSPVQGWAVHPGSDATFLGWRPIWAGLAVNSALYAASWVGMLFGPGVRRRWVRERRGSCRACGYDLRGSGAGVCPECGAATRVRVNPPHAGAASPRGAGAS